MLGSELAMAAWAVTSSFGDHYTWGDFVGFVVVAGCTVWYLVQTQHPEEQRRNADRTVEHIEQTPIWLFSAAILLPAGYTLLLLIAIRIQRYSIARKPMTTFLLTTSAHAASVLGVHAIALATPLHTWLEQGALPKHPLDIAIAAAALLAAVACYFTAQTLVIGIARGLAWGGWSVAEMIGEKKDNLDFLYALQLAVCATVVAAFDILLLPVVVAGIALHSTRDKQGLAAATANGERDRKTGLLRGDTFHAMAELTLANDQANDRSTAFLMCDLDFFKRWNDRYGHSGGDVVLKAFSGVLKRNTRLGDIVGRWGGEEFAVLLPGTSREDAEVLAERIRKAVEEMTISGLTELARGEPVAAVGGCTVSIGVAVSPQDATGYNELFDAADGAVYEAKETGRNKVVVATATARSSLMPDQESKPESTARFPIALG
jgi:diguanylate cyclase (GGDEF)-like protein